MIEPETYTDINGFIHWHVKYRMHREDGPAIQHKNGYERWWLNGQPTTKEDVFAYAIKNNNTQAIKALLWNKY